MSNRSKIKSKLVVLLVVLAFFGTFPNVRAQALLPWPPTAEWNVAKPESATSITGTTYGFVFTYDYNNSAVWNATQTWTLSATAVEARDISYNWHYSGLHAWFQVTANLAAYVTHNGTTSTMPLFTFVRPSGAGPFDGKGSATFHVEAGDTYGFMIDGKNYDSNHILQGTLEISSAPLVASIVSGTLGNNGWYRSNVSLSWNVTDGASPVQTGCDLTTLTNDTSEAGIAYTCTAANADGDTSSRIVIKRDATEPLTTDNAPAGWSPADVMVNLTASDDGSGVASTFYRIDGGPTQSGTSFLLTTNGTHSIVYWSTDVAGNQEAERTATVKINKDTGDLDVAKFNPSTTLPTNQSVKVNVIYPEYALSKQVSTDNLTWGYYTEPIEIAVNGTVYAKYQDQWGRSSPTSSYTIDNIDKAKPVTTVLKNVDPETNYVTLQFDARDYGSVVAATYYRVDEGDAESLVGASVQLRTHGMHTVEYWSVDAAGNEEVHQFLPVSVQLLPIGDNGFHIDDAANLLREGTLRQKDMNGDGIFDRSDIAIILKAITPILRR